MFIVFGTGFEDCTLGISQRSCCTSLYRVSYVCWEWQKAIKEGLCGKLLCWDVVCSVKLYLQPILSPHTTSQLCLLRVTINGKTPAMKNAEIRSVRHRLKSLFTLYIIKTILLCIVNTEVILLRVAFLIFKMKFVPK